MIDIKKINPKYILKNGKYWDYDRNQMFMLKDEEIEAIRKYFNDPNIASDRVIKDYKDPIVSSNYVSVRSKEASRLRVERLPENKARVVNPNNGRPYKISKQQPYNDGRYRIKKKSKGISFKKVVILGLTIFVVSTSFIALSKGKDVDVVPDISYEEIDNNVEQDNQMSTIPITEDNTVYIEENNIMGYINKYAQVYHLDAKVAYDKLSELTNNFTSDDYNMDMTIKNLSCKGNVIYADSYEELVIYYMRILKQAPERYGMNSNDLVGNTEYQSNVSSVNDYAKLIGHYCEVMREDPCLIYAIIQTETGFTSNALLNYHNPAGLMLSGGLWKFDTFEEGLIETIAQVKSYRLDGANTIEEIGAIHCPVGAANDPNGLNVNWIDNVNEIYKNVYENQEKLFGQVYISNDIKKI